MFFAIKKTAIGMSRFLRLEARMLSAKRDSISKAVVEQRNKMKNKRCIDRLQLFWTLLHALRLSAQHNLRAGKLLSESAKKIICPFYLPLDSVFDALFHFIHSLAFLRINVFCSVAFTLWHFYAFDSMSATQMHSENRVALMAPISISCYFCFAHFSHPVACSKSAVGSMLENVHAIERNSEPSALRFYNGIVLMHIWLHDAATGFFVVAVYFGIYVWRPSARVLSASLFSGRWIQTVSQSHGRFGEVFVFAAVNVWSLGDTTAREQRQQRGWLEWQE